MHQLGKRLNDANSAVTAAKMTPSAQARKLGGDTSPAELLSTLAAMHAMTQRQLAVQAEALGSLTLDTPAAELTVIQRFVAGAPAFCALTDGAPACCALWGPPLEPLL